MVVMADLCSSPTSEGITLTGPINGRPKSQQPHRLSSQSSQPRHSWTAPHVSQMNVVPLSSIWFALRKLRPTTDGVFESAGQAADGTALGSMEAAFFGRM